MSYHSSIHDLAKLFPFSVSPLSEPKSLMLKCCFTYTETVGFIRDRSPGRPPVVVCGHGLVTLSLTMNETLKWLSSLPILMQIILVVSVAIGIYTLPLPPPPYPLPFPPFSPSLISLMVSVDVKHHVYLLDGHLETSTQLLSSARIIRERSHLSYHPSIHDLVTQGS